MVSRSELRITYRLVGLGYRFSLYLDLFKSSNRLLDVPDLVVTDTGKAQRLKHLLNS
ncbi:MAG TPA: hypothetical protein VFY55_03875 [Nitrososphaeraceae archaeon]|nr:hypothetical protein [Nitrososphaeraceae archaeon]